MNFHKLFIVSLFTFVMAPIAKPAPSLFERIAVPLMGLESRIRNNYFTPQDALELLKITCTIHDAIENDDLVLTDDNNPNPFEIQSIGTVFQEIVTTFQHYPMATIFNDKPLLTSMVRDLLENCIAILGEVFVTKTTHGNLVCPAKPSECPQKTYCLYMCLNPILSRYEGFGRRYWNACTKFATATGWTLVAAIALLIVPLAHTITNHGLNR